MEYVLSYENLVRSLENIGITTVQGLVLYDTRNISETGIQFYLRASAIAKEYIEQTQTFLPMMKSLGDNFF